ncbi:hypothetical protein D2Q93_04545 [Alicyclobacillaceae bacterium I2511]|nr:hypothetical protein D2Q93_04545 [Alicyclobacillaceae bacterium I2511]
MMSLNSYRAGRGNIGNGCASRQTQIQEKALLRTGSYKKRSKSHHLRYWGNDGSGPRRRYYRITTQGHEQLAKNREF